MQTYIAFFRGINIGGHHKLPMKALVDILQKLGCHDVRTYIQSGNAIFNSRVKNPERLAGNIGMAINRGFGFHPQVFLLTMDELETAVATNPFPDISSKGNTLHLFLLAEDAANPDLRKLAALQSGSERFSLQRRFFYLYAPDGVGRSKLAANVEKSLGVTTTARNWNTVCKVLEIAAGPK